MKNVFADDDHKQDRQRVQKHQNPKVEESERVIRKNPHAYKPPSSDRLPEHIQYIQFPSEHQLPRSSGSTSPSLPQEEPFVRFL